MTSRDVLLLAKRNIRNDEPSEHKTEATVPSMETIVGQISMKVAYTTYIRRCFRIMAHH